MDIRTPWLQSQPPDLRIPPSEAVEAVRHQLLALLDDCEGFDCERLRWRLHTAGCGQDLWLLREAIFQMVASQHCAAQARDRLDGLVPAFRRVLPARMAGRV
jgi:hypothetical protein